MDIKKLSQETESYIIERRRYYHQHPELSGQEVNTCAAMLADVKALGITDIKEMKGCHGFIADIHGVKPGRTLALRTDTDALPITEQTGLPFASENPGVMHACGHDAHMAMLLGAAKMLMALRSELCGTVRLIVQPSEEYPVGAKAMIAEGAMDGVDAIYGNHVWGDFDAPYFDFSAGNRMASADICKITVDGVSAHGSAPNLGRDAIVAAASIITNVQTCVSRCNDPLSPMVVTLGTIEGGQRFNVIPNHVEMVGTTRSFLRGTAQEDLLRPIVECTGTALGCKAVYEHIYMTPPVINDNDELNRIAREAVTKLFGADMLREHPPMMGGEDFSLYAEKAPAIFGFIGTKNSAKGLVYSNHQEKFTVDEDCLARGAAVMVQFAADYLND